MIVPSTEAPISINLKSAGGTGITLRAETAEEFADMIANGIHIIVDAVKEVEVATKGLVGTSTPVTTMATMPTTASIAAQFGANIVETGTTIPAQEYTQPTQPAQVHSLGGRNCPHGKMTAIQGMGKDGKPYKGYFCPAPKGAFDKCKNQYVNMQSPDWNTFVPDAVK
jgi:hypothetical protein